VKTIRSPSIRFAAILTTLILIVASSIFAYPPEGLLSGFEEGTNDSELESCIWIRESIEDDGMVASDHRMSSMIFGFGYTNATWETAPNTIRGETLEDYADELNSTKTPSGEKDIDYVLISSEIENNVALTQWEPAEPMTTKAIEKFEKYPYYKIYDNGNVEIYMVSW
jgi:hypothetical protein